VLLACIALVPFAGCIFVRSGVHQLAVDAPQSDASRQVESPAKVHLKDGSVVVFPKGLTFDGEVIRGAGEQYDLLRAGRTPVEAVPIGRVAVIEYYTGEVSPVPTIAGTVLGVAILALMAYAAATAGLAGGI
jgi:hypothetical protein